MDEFHTTDKWLTIHKIYILFYYIITFCFRWHVKIQINPNQITLLYTTYSAVSFQHFIFLFFFFLHSSSHFVFTFCFLNFWNLLVRDVLFFRYTCPLLFRKTKCRKQNVKIFSWTRIFLQKETHLYILFFFGFFREQSVIPLPYLHLTNFLSTLMDIIGDHHQI